MSTTGHPTSARRGRGAPRGTRAEQLARAAGREEAVLALATTRTAAGAAIHTDDVVQLLGVAQKTAEEVLGALEAKGALQALAFRKEGWIAPAAAVTPRAPATLADLLALARAQASDEVEPRRGRQAMDVSRDLQGITTGQLADIERLGALILRHTPGADGDPARITGPLFAWDPSANAGRGAWALQAPVQAWVEAEHCAEYRRRQIVAPAGSQERAGRRSGGAWHPEMAKAAVGDYRGAVNNLLFLAATHGLIPRSPLNTRTATLYAPAWIPVLRRWAVRLLEEERAASAHRIHRGLRILAIAATQQGYTTLAGADWLAVRAQLREAAAAGELPRAALDAVRYTWVAIAGALAHRGIPLPEAYAWPSQRPERTTLVAGPAIDAAAHSDVGMAARDFSGWVLPDGRPAAALVEGRYGLRALCAWLTLPDPQLAGQMPPLPPRTWALKPTAGRRRHRNRVPRPYRTPSLRQLLQHLAQVTESLRRLGVDWTSEDLRALTPERIAQHVAAADARPADPRGDRRPHLRQTIQLMGRLFNGFLAARAAQDAAIAMAAGDAEACAAAAALRARCEAAYRALEGQLEHIPRGQRQTLKARRAEVVAIAQAWRGADRVEGLVKLTRLMDALLEEAIALAGGRSIEAQRDALRAGVFVPTPAWAERIRLVVLLLVLQRVPFRGRTVAKLTTDMWLTLPAAPDQQGRPLAPWEGAISFEIPDGATPEAAIMKAGDGFRPPLILPENVTTALQPGSPAHEVALRRDVLALYFLAGGARDVCRTEVDPRTGRQIRHQVPWLFPDFLPGDRHPQGRQAVEGLARGQWSRGAISRAFRSAVLRHARRLCVDRGQLRRTRGALGIHAVRRLYGTLWAPLHLVWTSRLLDHADIGITAALYTAQDERRMSLDVAALPPDPGRREPR